MLFFACITGYTIVSALDYPMERIEHLVIFFTILAITTAKYYSLSKDETAFQSSISYKSILGLLLISVVSLSTIVCSKRYAGEIHSTNILRYRHSANWNKLLSEVDRTISPFYEIDPMSIPVEWYRGVALFAKDNIPEAHKSFEKSYSLAPSNIHVLNNLASCYEKQGFHLKAEKYYVEALLISPNFFKIAISLNIIYSYII